MKFTIARLLKVTTLTVTLTAMIALAQITACADEVTIRDAAAGRLEPRTPTGTALTFNETSLGAVTSAGLLAIGNDATPAVNTNTLGSFTLGDPATTYTGQTFTLETTSGSPIGDIAGNPVSLTANLSGHATGTDRGDIFVDLDNPPVLFTFSDPPGRGSLFFNANDPSVKAGSPMAITGNITGTRRFTLPESATLLLFGAGLTGLGAGLRRIHRARKGQLPRGSVI